MSGKAGQMVEEVPTEAEDASAKADEASESVGGTVVAACLPVRDVVGSMDIESLR